MKLNLDKLVEKSGSTGSNNYIAWRFKLDLVLKTIGLFEIATGVTVRPFDGNNNLSNWQKKKILEAQTYIVINVDGNIALKLRVCTTAAQMIDRLETLYGKKSQTSQDGLRMQFFGYKYSGNKTLGEEIKDEWIIA